jgi:transcriptional regulator with XRE-family HTH domain
VDPKQRLGANVRALRDAAEMTQMDLSNRSGIDMAEISRIERGLKDVRLSTIVKVARGLDVSAGELLSGLP